MISPYLKLTFSDFKHLLLFPKLIIIPILSDKLICIDPQSIKSLYLSLIVTRFIIKISSSG